MQTIIDLSVTVGLPIKMNLETCSLVFDDQQLATKPAIRTVEQMKEVLYDKSVAAPEELYYMYRDIALPQDRTREQEHALRFDITVIKPDHLGPEYMKTAGHYHQGSYPELYEVVYGEAWCLLQKKADDFKTITDVILVKAKQGDKIVCLPDYGHILINPSKDKPLITSNWVSSRFSSEYTLYKEAGGAAYFFLAEGGVPKIVKNPFFTSVAPIRTVRAAQKIDLFGLASGVPMYPLIQKDAVKLAFLNEPKKFDYASVFVNERT